MSNVPTVPASFTPGLTTYRGSCHCGAVRYEVDLDLSEGTVRCNCTSCTKSGWWTAYVKPDAFRLLQGADRLTAFASGNPKVDEATTCGGCGIRAYGHGDIPELGGEFYSLNLRCLDDANLEGVQVVHLDGLHDTWAPLGTSVHTQQMTAMPAGSWETSEA